MKTKLIVIGILLGHGAASLWNHAAETWSDRIYAYAYNPANWFSDEREIILTSPTCPYSSESIELELERPLSHRAIALPTDTPLTEACEMATDIAIDDGAFWVRWIDDTQRCRALTSLGAQLYRTTSQYALPAHIYPDGSVRFGV